MKTAALVMVVMILAIINVGVLIGLQTAKADGQVVVTADVNQARGLLFECRGVMDINYRDGLWVVRCMEK